MSCRKSREDIDTETLNTVAAPQPISRARKLGSLIVICVAQLLDIFNASSAIILLPTLGQDLGFSESASVFSGSLGFPLLQGQWQTRWFRPELSL